MEFRFCNRNSEDTAVDRIEAQAHSLSSLSRRIGKRVYPILILNVAYIIRTKTELR